jgi:hypothetical protein
MKYVECDQLKTAEVLTASDNCGNPSIAFTELEQMDLSHYL